MLTFSYLQRVKINNNKAFWLFVGYVHSLDSSNITEEEVEDSFLGRVLFMKSHYFQVFSMRIDSKLLFRWVSWQPSATSEGSIFKNIAMG